MFVNAESYHFGRQLLRSSADAHPMVEAGLHLVGRTPVTSTEHALVPIANGVQDARTTFAGIVDDLTNDRLTSHEAGTRFAELALQSHATARSAHGEVSGGMSVAARAASDVSRQFMLAGSEARPVADGASIMHLWEARAAFDDAMAGVGTQRILGVPQ